MSRSRQHENIKITNLKEIFEKKSRRKLRKHQNSDIVPPPDVHDPFDIRNTIVEAERRVLGCYASLR